jgi:hypothetical protein
LYPTIYRSSSTYDEITSGSTHGVLKILQVKNACNTSNLPNITAYQHETPYLLGGFFCDPVADGELWFLMALSMQEQWTTYH